MIIIEEEKLEQMVRRAVKEEMEAILTKSGKVMDFIIGSAVKTENHAILKETEAILPEREVILPIRESEPPKTPKYLYSLKEVADFLHCSVPTAQKMKNVGRIPYRQSGRKLIFDTDAILKAMEQKKR